MTKTKKDMKVIYSI